MVRNDCDPEQGRKLEVPFCYYGPHGRNLVEVCITFVFALISLGITGVLAIGDAKAGFNGCLSQTARRPKQVVFWFFHLRRGSRPSRQRVFLMFGSMADILVPRILWTLLAGDAFA